MHTKRRKDWTVVAACALVAASCSAPDVTTVQHEAQSLLPYGRVELPQNPFSGRGIESEFVAAEAEIPGFGGFYLDEAGDLVAYMRDGGRADAPQVIEARFMGTPEQQNMLARPDGGTPRIRIVRGEYSMSQLIQWSETIRLNGSYLSRDGRQPLPRLGFLAIDRYGVLGTA